MPEIIILNVSALLFSGFFKNQSPVAPGSLSSYPLVVDVASCVNVNYTKALSESSHIYLAFKPCLFAKCVVNTHTWSGTTANINILKRAGLQTKIDRLGILRNLYFSGI